AASAPRLCPPTCARTNWTPRKMTAPTKEQPVAASPISPIVEAYNRDLRALLLSGPRNMLDDLIVSADGTLRTQKDDVRRELTRSGLVLVEYSLSGDLDAFPPPL